METVFEISDVLGIIIGVLLVLLTAIAIIRTIIKAERGEHIDVPSVGVINDLPSSVTGINKPDDLVERSKERSLKKTYDIF
jgi:hypothetical protein